MFSWLRPQPKDEKVECVVEWVLQQARTTFPEYFEVETKNLRQRQLKFEAISIYLSMALYLLREQNQKAQAVHDMMFDRFEISMREQGVADVRIGAEIRKFASAFHGRYDHYAAAFENDAQDALLETWARNMVCEGVDSEKSAENVMSTWQSIKSNPEGMVV